MSADCDVRAAAAEQCLLPDNSDSSASASVAADDAE